MFSLYKSLVWLTDQTFASYGVAGSKIQSSLQNLADQVSLGVTSDGFEWGWISGGGAVAISSLITINGYLQPWGSEQPHTLPAGTYIVSSRLYGVFSTSDVGVGLNFATAPASVNGVSQDRALVFSDAAGGITETYGTINNSGNAYWMSFGEGSDSEALVGITAGDFNLWMFTIAATTVVTPIFNNTNPGDAVGTMRLTCRKVK